MVRTRRRTVAAVLVSLVGMVFVGIPSAAVGQTAADHLAPDQTVAAPDEVAIAPSGRAVATPKFVDQRTNPQAPQTAYPERGPLGLNGKPTGTDLPSRPTQGRKPTGGADQPVTGGPNTAGSGVPAPLVPVPTTVNSNFDGINQAAGGGAEPPDVNAAIGLTQILEPVNRRVTVFSKTGVQQCTNTLAGWLGQGTLNVFDPRALYDTLNNRFILIATTSGVAGQAPRLFLAASTTANACGSWFIYTITFTGPLFPVGTLLDYPYLGQDRVAILSSTNNFNPGYINSTAWSVPKSAVYAGAGFSFSVFQVAFSTAPVTVNSIPIGPTANTFFVASVPGTGYNLYRMTNSAGPGTTLVLQATIASAFTPPPRRANQCGGTTLDPLDGRIVWAPVQAVNSPNIWFTHGINISGFPGIRYGAISTTANAAFVANAFHSATSDDINPSIGAFEETPNGFYIWLNWAYTDPGASPCRNTSTTVNGVVPGGGVPTLTNSDLTLVIGALTTTNTRFGDYSSVALDPVAVNNTCPRGRTALLAQQYFNTAGWVTRLARVSFGPGC